MATDEWEEGTGPDLTTAAISATAAEEEEDTTITAGRLPRITTIAADRLLRITTIAAALLRPTTMTGEGRRLPPTTMTGATSAAAGEGISAEGGMTAAGTEVTGVDLPLTRTTAGVTSSVAATTARPGGATVHATEGTAEALEDERTLRNPVLQYERWTTVLVVPRVRRIKGNRLETGFYSM